MRRGDAEISRERTPNLTPSSDSRKHHLVGTRKAKAKAEAEAEGRGTTSTTSPRKKGEGYKKLA